MTVRSHQPLQALFKQVEKKPALAWSLSIGLLGLFCWFAFLWRLGSIGLVDETEPLFAEAARQMIERNDWVTPYFNLATRFDKPPLVYWLMAIGYKTIGVNEWAVRLPSALSAVALVIFTFLTLKQFGTSAVPPSAKPADRFPDGSRWFTAWIGAAALSLNIQMMAWARTGVSDMLLNACIGGALLAFFWGYTRSTSRSKSLYYLAFYTLCGLGVLTKGPIGIVIPILVIGTFALFMGNIRPLLRELHIIPGTILFLLIVLPWNLLVIQANGQKYIDVFFGYHNFTRFADAVNNHEAPWFFYFIVVLLGFLPWSVHLPVAIARLRFWQRTFWQQQPRSAQLGIFALSWFSYIFFFFTIAATKLPSYVLPLMPAAAILVALLWGEQVIYPRFKRAMTISSLFSMLLFAGLAGLLLYSPNWMGDDPAMPNFPDVIRNSGVLVVGAIVWAMAAIAIALLLLSRHGYWVWAVNLLVFLAFLIGTLKPAVELMDQERQLPLRLLSETITEVRERREPVLMITLPKPSVVFYTQKPVMFIPDPEEVPEHLQKLATRRNPPKSILILGTHRKIILGLQLPPEQHETLQSTGAYRLIRVKLPLKPSAQQP